jgi:hypothetical protein
MKPTAVPVKNDKAITRPNQPPPHNSSRNRITPKSSYTTGIVDNRFIGNPALVPEILHKIPGAKQKKKTKRYLPDSSQKGIVARNKKYGKTNFNPFLNKKMKTKDLNNKKKMEDLLSNLSNKWMLPGPISQRNKKRRGLPVSRRKRILPGRTLRPPPFKTMPVKIKKRLMKTVNRLKTK